MTVTLASLILLSVSSCAVASNVVRGSQACEYLLVSDSGATDVVYLDRQDNSWCVTSQTGVAQRCEVERINALLHDRMARRDIDSLHTLTGNDARSAMMLRAGKMNVLFVNDNVLPALRPHERVNRIVVTRSYAGDINALCRLAGCDTVLIGKDVSPSRALKYIDELADSGRHASVASGVIRVDSRE